MKKLFNTLPFRLLLGIIVGVILGQVFPESVMKVVVTLQYIMGQLITFCVPLIIIGFIAPSITKLGKKFAITIICWQTHRTDLHLLGVRSPHEHRRRLRPHPAPVHRH